METKTKNIFKAVEFMRQVRSELSDLYHTDKDLYHKELKETMADFLKARTKSVANHALPQSGQDDVTSASPEI